MMVDGTANKRAVEMAALMDEYRVLLMVERLAVLTGSMAVQKVVSTVDWMVEYMVE